jgi:hypothetical protein
VKLADLLECPKCGDAWPCEDTICESCGARLLPYRLDAKGRRNSMLRAVPDEGPMPVPSRESKGFGAIVTFEASDGQRCVLHRLGSPRQALDAAWDDAQIADPSYRVISVSTPTSIFTDLQGGRKGNQTPHIPEFTLCGGSRRHYLHERLRGSSRQRMTPSPGLTSGAAHRERTDRGQ